MIPLNRSGEFLRDHLDVLKWEAANAAPIEPAKPQPAVAPLTPDQAVALSLGMCFGMSHSGGRVVV